MRRLLLILLLLSPVCALAATPVVVSGTMQSVGATGVSANSYVMFRLRNYAGFVPRVVGTGVIAQTQIKCSNPSCVDNTGHFSIQIWSNTDIIPNTCGETSSAPCTWYTIEFWANGALASSGNYCIPNSSPTYDLNSAIPCQTPPLPPGPATGTGGTSISLLTNGTPNASQNILNMIAGANITLTPNGVGGLTITSTGGGNVGDALLTPPSAQTFQATAPTVAIHFKCPTGAANGFTSFDFTDADNSNIMGIKCGTKTVQFSDGISGHWLAQYFGNSVGTIASQGLLRGANTDVLFAWRNNAGTGDVTVNKDNTDTVIWSNAAHIKSGSNFIPNGPSMTIGTPMTATASDQFQGAALYINAAAYTDAGGDDCKTLHDAIVAANTAGNLDVYAGAIKPGASKKCVTSPIPDAYAGTIWLGSGNWKELSNAAQWRLHSRVKVKGSREARGLSGSTSGSMISACNADDAVCSGAVWDPDASALCKDGAGSTVHCGVVTWSVNATPGLPTSQMFGGGLEDVTVGCQSIANCIGISAGMFPISGGGTQKFGPQENVKLSNLRVEDWGNGTGRAIKLMPGTSNFQVDGVNALNEGTTIADCSLAAAFDILFDSAVSANGPKRLDNLTNTNGGCTINPANGMLLDAGEVGVRGSHWENVTDASILIGSRSNSFGFNLQNPNGVGTGASSATVRLASGHSISGVIAGALNINVSGYTIKDDYHGKVIPVICQSMTGFYSFGTGIADPVITDAPCLALAQVVSAPWIATGASAITAGSIVKLVTASSTLQVTVTGNTTDTKEPLGIAMNTPPDTTVKVAVAIGGIVGTGGIPGPIADTGQTCAANDFVYYGTTTDGLANCSALRPYNEGVVGRALGAATAGQTIPMIVRPEPTMQPITGCTGTGANPVLCATAGTSKNVGTVACPHSTTAATCTINTNAVTANSVIQITRTTQLGVGAGQCEAAPVETAASVVPLASLIAATSFTINVPTLTGTQMFCLNYTIVNP